MATFTDDFNRPDNTDLGAGWVEVSGNLWAIISGQLSPGAAGGTILVRAATPMDSNDHFAQMTIAATASASQGLWIRGTLTAPGYLWRNDGSGWTLFAVVGGSFISIGSYAAAAVPGDVAKLQAVGSVIKAFVNGVERVSVTDTNVPTGNSVGIRSESTSALRYDDFAAGDISTATEATLTTVTSTETARPLTGTKSAALAPAGATETAQALTGTKAAALAPAGATETAQPLLGVKTAVLSTVVEEATARPLTATKAAVLTRASTVEQAMPLTAPGISPGDDLHLDITVGPPHSGWTVSAPYTDWEVGPPC